MTKQRAAILQVLHDTPGHMTAEQIFHLAQSILPSISLATIYNNLNAMHTEGLVRRLKIDGDSDRYDRNPHPHGHLVCSFCGEIEDISLPHFQEYLEDHLHTPAASYELIIHTRCSRCRTKSK